MRSSDSSRHAGSAKEAAITWTFSAASHRSSCGNGSFSITNGASSSEAKYTRLAQPMINAPNPRPSIHIEPRSLPSRRAIALPITDAPDGTKFSSPELLVAAPTGTGRCSRRAGRSSHKARDFPGQAEARGAARRSRFSGGLKGGFTL
jgi:hypothetical protein